MSVYLHDIPLPEARIRLQRALEEADLWRVLGTERIPLDEKALGRILAMPVWARVSSPHYHATAMDGFALRSESTLGAQTTSPLTIELDTTQTSDRVGTAVYVDTGDPLPSWANAVVPIENIEGLDREGQTAQDIRHPSAIRIRAAVTPWMHVRPLGEDIVATELVLPAGQVLRPVDLGAAAAAGHTSLIVARRPRVAVIPTGTELVPPGAELAAGSIVEYNSLVLAAQVISMGAEATRYPITADDLMMISRTVSRASQDHDLVLLNAGSSAGAEDFSARVVEALGTMLVHGVAVRPGHPVIIGMLSRRLSSLPEAAGAPRPMEQPESADSRARSAMVPIIGVPGFPVSAALTVDLFVEPLIAKWLGRAPGELPVETAELTRKVNSSAGDEDYVRVAVGKVGNRLLAAPLSRAAGVITSLVRADGLLVVPPGVQGIEAGDKVSIQLYRTAAEIERTIFCIGSHDVALDLIAQYLYGQGRRFVSANVGSEGGLISLARRYAHLCGSHLLDPETGEYNVPQVRRYLPGIPVRVVSLVGRDQGLIVNRGNPKQLGSMSDLSRADVRFINRQRGSGTRVLLDYHLQMLGISPQTIHGYNQEEFTHLAVAAAVSSGRADCGLGIAAGAAALNLDFIPLFRERYDLVIPKEHADGELLAPLVGLLHNDQFRSSVGQLPGYDTSVMGTVILEDA